MHLSEWEDIFRLDFNGLWPLLAQAGRLREARIGHGISLCVIINAKSGHCPQDCAFCAQSRRSTAAINTYPLLPREQLVAAAQQAAAQGAARFSIVTSGRGVASPRERQTIMDTVTEIRATTPLKVCVSLGIVDEDFLRDLAFAGVYRYHHNIETAASFYPQIATAHRFEERTATIRAAQAAGLRVCVGGIFGLGESVAQRYEMARIIQELEVDAIPLNFLQPIPGTPLADRQPLNPLEALQTILAFRLFFPDKQIIIAGGRAGALRSLAPLMFAAGADALMTGDYLTTKGQLPAQDLEMLADLGLHAHREAL
ncbi:MAG: biotin synthase BioB [Deltaproteobacteria bacterium]|nr:biotin synthase BioB [Deltaproteobacteria bacterium]